MQHAGGSEVDLYWYRFDALLSTSMTIPARSAWLSRQFSGGQF
jgi:hypothetical protein